MGHFVYKLPDVGEGTAEAEIVAWHVAVGQRVAGRPATRRRDDGQGDGGDDLAGFRHRGLRSNGEPGRMATVGAPLVEFEIEVGVEAGEQNGVGGRRTKHRAAR